MQLAMAKQNCIKVIKNTVIPVTAPVFLLQTSACRSTYVEVVVSNAENKTFWSQQRLSCSNVNPKVSQTRTVFII